MRQHATGEKVPELLLHEHRQASALGVVSGCGQERIQVRCDDAVQHAALGVARLIRGAGHARDIHPADGSEQCRKSDTSKALGVGQERMLQAGRPLSGAPSCSAPVTNLPWTRVFEEAS